MYGAAFPAEQRDVVDLRSDTVTRPSAEMYEAMRSAPLGDDVLGDDPTVVRLEEMAAKMLGKEAALFVSSGTMGNQLALAGHCRPGEAIFVEQDSHIVNYEVGASALLAGVNTWTMPSDRGAIDPEQIERRAVKADLHSPGTSLICIENTHNRAGGAIIPQGMMAAYREVADRKGMKFHLDGARVFNASAALGIPVAEITKFADSVTFCLSKGLGSPVGSVLCGDAAFIDRARIWRKRLGGGTRQAGLLAACGIVSLTSGVKRLGEDHARAKRLAREIAGLPGLCVEVEHVETNMVMVDTHAPAAEWRDRLREAGVWCFNTGAHRLRLVFHVDIDDVKTERAIEAFRAIAQP